MDYVTWCDLVLTSLVGACQATVQGRLIGVNFRDLARIIGDSRGTNQAYEMEVYDALSHLRQIGMAEPTQRTPHYWKPTSEGRHAAEDVTRLWEAACNRRVDLDHLPTLRAVNRLSPVSHDDHAFVEWVAGEVIVAESGPSEPDILHGFASEMAAEGLIERDSAVGRLPKLRATYLGLVWETRQGYTQEARFIDQLAEEWETTSVDFKRELELRTNDHKAEFVKDVLSLANTQASGRRWMVIGFDDKTRAYHAPPDPKLTQNRFEQVLSRYTAPVVTLHYKTPQYRAHGLVGLLEVLRNPQHLPYRIARSLTGEKRTVVEGQVFVRHGSQVEPATERELKALVAEAERAQTITH